MFLKSILGASIVVQKVMSLLVKEADIPNECWVSSTVSLRIQFPANVHEKMAEDGPST